MNNERLPLIEAKERLEQVDTTIDHVNDVILNRARGFFESPIVPSDPPFQLVIESVDIALKREKFVKDLLEGPLPALFRRKEELKSDVEIGEEEVSKALETLRYHGLTTILSTLSEGENFVLSDDKKVVTLDSDLGESNFNGNNKPDEEIERKKERKWYKRSGPKYLRALEIAKSGQEFTAASLAGSLFESDIEQRRTTLERAVHNVRVSIIPVFLHNDHDDGQFVKRRDKRRMYYRFVRNDEPVHSEEPSKQSETQDIIHKGMADDVSPVENISTGEQTEAGMIIPEVSFHLSPVLRVLYNALFTTFNGGSIARSELKRISASPSKGAFSYNLSTLKQVLKKNDIDLINIVPQGKGEPSYILRVLKVIQ